MLLFRPRRFFFWLLLSRLYRREQPAHLFISFPLRLILHQKLPFVFFSPILAPVFVVAVVVYRRKKIPCYFEFHQNGGLTLLLIVREAEKSPQNRPNTEWPIAQSPGSSLPFGPPHRVFVIFSLDFFCFVLLTFQYFFYLLLFTSPLLLVLPPKTRTHKHTETLSGLHFSCIISTTFCCYYLDACRTTPLRLIVTAVEERPPTWKKIYIYSFVATHTLTRHAILSKLTPPISEP